MSKPKLRLVPVDRATESTNISYKTNRRAGKMLLGTYGYKTSDANGNPQWKIVNIPDEIY